MSANQADTRMRRIAGTLACVYARLANAPANAQAGATPATPANGENAAPSTASELHEPSAQPPMADDICRALEQSAAENALPVEFFGRVIWQESRFDARAVSPPTVLHKEIPGMGRAKRYIITIADDDRAPLDKLCRKLIAADATCDVMRNLHRAGSLRADPAAIAVDRRVTIDGRRSGATLVPRGHLFRARDDVRVSREAEAGAWLATPQYA